MVRPSAFAFLYQVLLAFLRLCLSDFPEGPDWWGLDEQKRVLEAVAQSEKNSWEAFLPFTRNASPPPALV